MQLDESASRALDASFQQEVLKALKAGELREESAWMALVGLPTVRSPRSQKGAANYLNPALELIPYQAYSDDFEREFSEWVESDEEIAVRVYSADGGAGKTRFMLEKLKQFASRGWRVGFLSRDDRRVAADEATYQGIFDAHCGVMLAVDYAEDRHRQLDYLLMALSRSSCSYPIRLVLLTRRVGRWWEQFRLQASQESRDFLRDSEPEFRDLPDLLVDVARRSSLYRLTIEALEATKLKAVGSDFSAPDLQKSLFELPLFVQLAALDRYLGGSGEGDEKGLLRRVLEHESNFWQRENLSVEGVRQLMAQITLWQGVPVQQLANLPHYWPKEAPAHTLETTKFHSLICDLYQQEEQIQPLLPDRLGETLIEELLESSSRNSLLSAVLGEKSEPQQLLSCFSVLARLSSAQEAEKRDDFWHQLFKDFPQKLVEIAKHLQKQLEATQSVTEKTELAWDFLYRMPRQIPALADFHVLSGRILLAQLPETDGLRGERAGLLNNLSIDLAAVGEREKALTAAEKSVAIYGELARDQPEEYEFKLAQILSNLAIMLAKYGKKKEALLKAKESLDIFSYLAKDHPEKYLHFKAKSLTNIANRFSDLEEHKEALLMAEDAVGLYRQLEQDRPGDFRIDLAASLNNLANRYLYFKELKKARVMAKKAIDIRRQLYQERPNAFKHDLATSLCVMGQILKQDEVSLSEARNCFYEGIELQHFGQF